MPYGPVFVRVAKRCVVPTPENWWDAFRDCFDPDEAADLPIYTWAPAADAVGHAMQVEFARGRLAYINDQNGCNWWASPRAVLFRGGGQCAALSLLAASALACHDDIADVAMVIGWVYNDQLRGRECPSRC